MLVICLHLQVNASGQFCGVAQMTGPVDFAKSVDYWQQDKWNGRFTVTWHIIKDIPNCQFRHIILENNDNKPVTNSRDTQEVILSYLIVSSYSLRLYPVSSLQCSKSLLGSYCTLAVTGQQPRTESVSSHFCCGQVKFDQGIGMLNIFKSFASKTSILDDFQFYENRQRALTEKRARQLAQQQREQHRQVCIVTNLFAKALSETTFILLWEACLMMGRSTLLD